MEEFVGIGVMNSIPDATTDAFFRERLRKAEVIEELFEKFETYLRSPRLGPNTAMDLTRFRTVLWSRAIETLTLCGQVMVSDGRGSNSKGVNLASRSDPPCKLFSVRIGRVTWKWRLPWVRLTSITSTLLPTDVSS